MEEAYEEFPRLRQTAEKSAARIEALTCPPEAKEKLVQCIKVFEQLAVILLRTTVSECDAYAEHEDVIDSLLDAVDDENYHFNRSYLDQLCSILTEK